MSTRRPPFETVQTFARTPAKILCRDAHSRLLIRWRHALRFTIGIDGEDSFDQLPTAESFPKRFPKGNPDASARLMDVLGVAALKLYRPWAQPADTRFEVDTLGGWIRDLADGSHPFDRGRLHVVGRVVQLALRAPERLPVLIARLDALTNEDLHRMAMDAVQGRRVKPDVFEGLME